MSFGTTRHILIVLPCLLDAVMHVSLQESFPIALRSINAFCQLILARKIIFEWYWKEAPKMENFARQTEWVDKISKDTLSSVCSNNSWILSNVIPQLLCNFAQIWPSVCALEEMCFWHPSFGNQFLSCQNEGGTPVLISNLFALVHIISWHWQSEKNKTNFHPTYMIMARVTIYAHLGQKNLHSIPFLYVSRNKRWKSRPQ